MRTLINKITNFISPWEEHSFEEKGSFLMRLRSQLKKLYFWSQKEYDIRYQPILKELKKEFVSSKILEVGSGSLGLSRYIKREMIGLDINIQGPHYSHLRLIKANAWELPFKDGEFDLVVSLDVLEHIPREYRSMVVVELLRVSKKKVFLGFPSGDKAKAWEAKAMMVYNHKLTQLNNDQGIKNKFIARNAFLLEHAHHVIPDVQEVYDYIKSSKGASVHIQVLDNESVYVWYWGVLSHMKYSYIRWILTTIVYIVLFPLLARVQWGGAYRKIFIINKEGANNVD